MFYSLFKSQSGVYENEPDSLLGIARGDERADSAHLLVTQSAAERKDAFLKKAAGDGPIKRLDPKVSYYSWGGESA